MSFRLRLTVLVALAMTASVVATSTAIYYTDRQQLIAQVDSDLRSTLNQPEFAKELTARSGNSRLSGQIGPQQRVRVQPITPKRFQLVLPQMGTSIVAQVSPRADAGAASDVERFATARINGLSTRTLTVLTAGAKVTLSQSLVGVDRNLSHLRLLLILVSLGGIVGAAILAAFVAARAMRPLRELTETTEQILETGDLSRRTGRHGHDEISRLSGRLDELLVGLESSLRTQRQLVADASHELRTPIAVLRANIGVLAKRDQLDPAEREALLDDVQDELEAMTELVGELIELAHGDEPAIATQAFRLDLVVDGAITRVARRWPEISFRPTLEPSTVLGSPERVERAVANLLDNARKWSEEGQTVEIGVRDGMVEVRDHGPGIAAEDAPLVFNRFFRAKAARARSGAGLGLSIVKQVADSHGGKVTIDRSPDGGAIVRLQLPECPPSSLDVSEGNDRPSVAQLRLISRPAADAKTGEG